MSTQATATPITENESAALAVHAGTDPTQIAMFEAESLQLHSQALGIRIVDQDSYNAAVEAGKSAAGFIKRWKEWIQHPYDVVYGTYQRILQTKKAIEGPAEEAKRHCGNEILRWDSEQEQARLAEQRRREEEQRKQEEERRLAAAAEAEQAGASEETVQQIIEQQSTAPKPTVAPAYQKAAGAAVRSNWMAEITDVAALARFVTLKKNEQFLEVLELKALIEHHPALNRLAKTHEAALNDILPGVRAVNKGAASFRAPRS